MTATDLTADLAEATAAWERGPRRYESALALGALLIRAARLTDAREPLTFAAEHPKDVQGDAAQLLASTLAATERFDDAADWWQVACEKRPGVALLRWNLALAHQRAGDDAKAIDAKRAYLAIADDDGAAWADLGAHLTRTGRHDEALVAFAKAREQDPSLLDGSYEEECEQRSKDASA